MKHTPTLKEDFVDVCSALNRSKAKTLFKELTREFNSTEAKFTAPEATVEKFIDSYKHDLK
jgi:hypothetical protein